jgi:glycosyltransferase involved in cell wall biosynthesis
MKNILVITYWSYPDALIQTYTLPYVKIIQKNLPHGSKVFLLTLEKERLNHADRLKIEVQLKKESIIWLPFHYRSFGLSAFFSWIGVSLKLCFLILQKNISTIHCWCTPAGAIGYFLATFLNRQLVIDSYEPHAEAMVENGTWRKSDIAFLLLFWLEKKQTQRANQIISATEGMRKYSFNKYGVEIKNFFVKPSCVNLEDFSIKNLKNKDLLQKFGLLEKIVCAYAGKFGGIYLEKEAFDFFKEAADYWGESFRVLLLTNHDREQIDKYCRDSFVSPEIVVSTYVPHHSIAWYMGLGDFAITPVKPVPSKRYCTPIKDGEYWALGLPVVIPANISDDSEIIEENSIGAVLSTFDKPAYKEAIEKIDTLLQQPKDQTFNKIRAIANRYRSFQIAEKVYRQIYE